MKVARSLRIPVLLALMALPSAILAEDDEGYTDKENMRYQAERAEQAGAIDHAEGNSPESVYNAQREQADNFARQAEREYQDRHAVPAK
jgi:hypothetical protein